MSPMITLPVYDVFISYARADGRELAKDLYHTLEENGLRPWRD